MKPQKYFSSIENPVKKQYDALREYFYYNMKARDIVQKYGYTEASFYGLIKDFKNQMQGEEDRSGDCSNSA